MELQPEPRERSTPELAPPPPLGLRLRRRAAWVGGLLALAVVGYLLSGIFTVAADEQAVIRRFGRVAARLGPGIHYRRSEERRVGEEGRSRWSADHLKKKNIIRKQR